MIRNRAYAIFLATLLSALTIGERNATATPSGKLHVALSGFESNRGAVVVKLYVKGDDVPRGPGTRQISMKIVGKKAGVDFEKLPHGTYAVFAFHDENENGTLDHNLLRFPKESLGFSNGFRVTLVSGIPDFEDLKFDFNKTHTAEAIVMH